jgi:uncharacterized protein
MRPYALSAAQFQGLAGGYGDPTALAVLRDGQLAKSRLLLLAIAEGIRGHGRPDTEPFFAALALLRAAERRVPAAARAALEHPYLGRWSAHLLRRSAGGGSDGWAAAAPEIGYFAALAGAACASARLRFDLVVPAGTHGVVLPMLGQAHGLGPGAVRVRGDERSIVFSDPGRSGGVQIEVTAPFRQPARGWWPRTTLAVGAGAQRLDVAVDDTDPYRDCFGSQPMERLAPAAADDLRRNMEHAWRILVRVHPRHATAIRTTLRSLVPLRAPQGGSERFSATCRDAFGAVGIALPADPESLVELLLHEVQHVKLCALLDLVELHRDDGRTRYYAPWRPEPRPVGALLQGAYAHLAVTDYWRVRRSRGPATGERDAHVEFAYWRLQIWLVLGQLLAGAELTGNGVRFVRAMTATVRGWWAEPVPRWAEAVASRRAAEHLAAWRSANPAAARRLPRVPPPARGEPTASRPL